MSTAPVNGEIMVRPTTADAQAKLAATPAAAVPQYMQGFEGAASGPFPADSLKVLGAPVNPEEVEIKPNGIVYLPGVAYRRILTRAFGAGAWALLPRGPARKMDENVIYHGALYILGRFVSEAVGECETRFGMSYASSLEGARTDALTRCCKDLGVATELWDPEWRSAWQAAFCKKEWRKDEKTGKDKVHWTKLPKEGGGEPSGRNVGGPVTQELEATLKASLEQQRAARAADEGLGDAAERHGPSAPGSVSETTQTPPGQGVNPGAGGQATNSQDTGIAPTAAEVAEVRAAIKKLGWAQPKARLWAKNTFGVASSGEMTSDQCAAALALLMAAQLDDDDAEYAKVYDRFKAAGRVL